MSYSIKQIMLDVGKESYRELKRVARNGKERSNIPSFNQSPDLKKIISLLIIYKKNYVDHLSLLRDKFHRFDR